MRNKKGQFIKGSNLRKGIKHSDSTKEKIRLSRLGKSSWNKGIPMSEESKIKDKISHLGKKHTKESKDKTREWMVNHPNRKFKNTGIEIKIEQELIKRRLNYQKQVPLCKIAIVDFYLPEYRIVIQADGDYWHNLPKQKEKDIKQDSVLTFNGFNVYRFWEHDINESVEKCISKIIIFL